MYILEKRWRYPSIVIQKLREEGEGSVVGIYRFVRLSLDALPEFGSRALEVLRQPIEDKIVTISRAHGTLTFPANIQLITVMHPCPCGYYGDPAKPCTCSAYAVCGATITRYQKRCLLRPHLQPPAGPHRL